MSAFQNSKTPQTASAKPPTPKPDLKNELKQDLKKDSSMLGPTVRQSTA